MRNAVGSWRLHVVAALTSLMLASGCANHHALTTPEGYVSLKNPGAFDYRATSAHGTALALSSHPNEDRNGGLKFWSDAVEYQKVTLDGMKLAARDSLKSSDGVEGTLFDFRSGEGDGQLAYLIGLYVTAEKVHVIEAAGPASAVEADHEKLRTAMASFHR